MKQGQAAAGWATCGLSELILSEAAGHLQSWLAQIWQQPNAPNTKDTPGTSRCVSSTNREHLGGKQGMLALWLRVIWVLQELAWLALH